MNGSALSRARRRVGLALGAAAGAWLIGWIVPGLPIVWGPRASAAEKEAGRALFVHEWTPGDPLAKGDGLGPVYNADSCVACHFQGGVGGGGDNRRNVVTFEALPVPGRPEPRTGLVHHHAVDRLLDETAIDLHQLFPIVRGAVAVVNHCEYRIPDFDPVHTQGINTTALFGAGWIDRIGDKAIRRQGLARSLAVARDELNLKFEGVGAGRARVLPDGRVGKFGWKGQFATLEEFVAAACANEIGLGNPRMGQARPLGRPAATGPAADLDPSQFRSLVAFVDTLPRPVEAAPAVAAEADRAARGKDLFGAIGCAVCHTPDLGGVAGVYSDFLLHRLEAPDGPGSYDRGPLPVPLPDDYPAADEWKTPPLWGVADSAPYFHDGASATLDAAIRRHHGDAEPVNKAYEALSETDQAALISFLQTLKAPPDAHPAPEAAEPTRLARNGPGAR